MKKKTKTSSNETATVAPSAYSQPYIDDAAKTFRPAYDEGMEIQRQFQPGIRNAFNLYNDTMNGKFIDSNPYMDDIVRASNEDAADSVNQAFMPRFGSGYHAKTLAREVANNTARIRGANYDQERAYMDAAGGRMAGLATTATMLPSIPSTTYADNVGGLMGRYNTSTGKSNSTTTQSGGLGSILGPLMQVGSMFMPAGGLLKGVAGAAGGAGKFAGNGKG